MHFVGKSETKEQEKDLWQTPKALFKTLEREFEFNLDVCASAGNKLCFRHLSEDKSALDHEWLADKAAFINPPYSKTAKFLERAAQQAEKHNITVVALVNANTDTEWFYNAAQTANEIRLIQGRIAFEKPDGKKANGNTKGQCLIIWRGNSKSPCQINMVKRDDLLD